MSKLVHNKTAKRVFAILMAFILVAGLFPYSGTAYGDDPAAPEAQQAAAQAAETEPAGATDEAASADAAGTVTDSLPAQDPAPKKDGDSTPAASADDGKADGAGASGVAQALADQPIVDVKSAAKAKQLAQPRDADPFFINGERTIGKGETLTVNVVASDYSAAIEHYTLTVNGTLSGTVFVPADKTLTVKGSGTINGTVNGVKQGSVIVVEGNGKLVIEGTVKITGGNGQKPTSGHTTSLCGGGILVQQGGKLHMKGGLVQGNQAERGGGVYVGKNASFTMDGGAINKNEATVAEGGGIYVTGWSQPAIFNKGSITNNTTKTTEDWGGGGIFVQSGAKAVFTTATVTGNTAYGLGGGISGCPHAVIGIGNVTGSAAVFGNTAYKEGKDPNTLGRPDKDSLYDNSNGLGDKYAYDAKYDGANFTAALAQDFYCTQGSTIAGELADGSGVAYVGRYAGKTASGDVTIKEGHSYTAGEASLGLTAKGKETGNRNVVISGNTSYTHGGGIGTNGTIELGKFNKTEETVGSFSVPFSKKLLNLENADVISKPELAGKFTFGLYANKNAKEPIATAQNEADGSVTFVVDNDNYRGTAEGQTVTFYAKETGSPKNKKDEPLFENDSKWHSVTLTLIKKTESQSVGGVTHKTHLTMVKYGSVSYGNEDAGEGKVFTNKVKPDYKQIHQYTPWTIEFTKELRGAGEYADKDILTPDFEGKYTFGLFEPGENGSEPAEGAQPITTATNGKDGKVTFSFNEEMSKKYAGAAEGAEGRATYTFYAKEIAVDHEPAQVSQDAQWHKVTLTVEQKKTEVDKNVGTELEPVLRTTFESKLVNTEFSSEEGKGQTFINTIIPEEEERSAFTPWEIVFDKTYLNGLGDSILEPGQFEFGLYRANEDGSEPADDAEPVVTAKNAEDGSVTFKIDEDKAKDFEGVGTGKTYTFYAKEIVTDANDLIHYDQAWHKVTVKVERKTETFVEHKDGNPLKPVNVTLRTSYVPENGVTFDGGNNDFTNTLKLVGQFNLDLEKHYYGATEDAEGLFSFRLQQIPAVDDVENVDLNRIDESEGATSLIASNKAFDGNGMAAVEFDPIRYEDIDLGEDNAGTASYWYRVTEEGASDPRVYVFKVDVKLQEDGMAYVTEMTDLYYAESLEDTKLVKLDKEAGFTPEGAIDAENAQFPALEFHNFQDGVQGMSVYGYAVNAASGAPIDQQCLVDPKIYKELEGRSMQPGEFNFQLVQVAGERIDGVDHVDWGNTSGQVVSETSNDQYGMVDFDKASNVSGDPDNPCCLLFTAPGVYYYRVVEANAAADPAVDYSKQIITFTVVVEADDQGQLEATDMYYGHVENGENVRYDESADSTWHPTMINVARGMDLMVQKTSDLDRSKGLEGATYGLYAVSDNTQADVLLANETSDADGWITFKNVNLSAGTLYYFKEIAAPAGHTVSEFRSACFYLVPDAAAPNGYVMRYTDSKTLPADDTVSQAQVAPQAADDAAGEDAAQGQPATTPTTSDDGNLLFVFENDGGVHDEATVLSFNKLDTKTHEWVVGAKLSIIEKDTGTVVQSWTSGEAAEKLEGALNVDTTYILREDQAPEGYAKADAVEFVIDENGKARILSGAAKEDEATNAEIVDSTLTLYDTMLDVEEIETINKEKIVETPGEDKVITTTSTSTINAPKTGDYIPFVAVGVIAVVALIALLVAVRRNRKSDK